MGWTIEYSGTARAQLAKLDRNIARRVIDYMEERVAVSDDPRSMGRALKGPMGGLWRDRVGDCRVLCSIQDNAVRILVVRIGRRDSVYR